MGIQLTYGFTYDRAIKGMPVDTGNAFDVTAYAAVDIPVGVGLMYAPQTVDDQKIKVVPWDGTGSFAGIAIMVQDQPEIADTFMSVAATQLQSVFKAGEPITLRQKGFVWVNSETAVKPYNEVHVRKSGAGTQGDFRNAASGTDTNKLVNLRWHISTTAAGLALVEILYVSTLPL